MPAASAACGSSIAVCVALSYVMLAALTAPLALVSVKLAAVTVALLIGSENVALIAVVALTLVAESAGLTAITVGRAMSGVGAAVVKL